MLFILQQTLEDYHYIFKVFITNYWYELVLLEDDDDAADDDDLAFYAYFYIM